MKKYQLCIAGTWCAGSLHTTVPVINPATEAAIAEVCAASVDDVDAAVAAAQLALSNWSKQSMRQRGKVIGFAASALRERIDDIAVDFTREQGKPLNESVGELKRAVETLEWIAGVASQPFSRDYTTPDQRRYAKAQPVGVVAALTPWNYPAVLIARKVGYALLAGCTVVLKAAEEVPSVAVAFVQAFLDAGVPAGGLSLLFGNPAQISDRLLHNNVVRKLSFTGSTAVGKLLARKAANQLTQCTLELGGHAPVIVFDDVDVAETVRAIVDFKFECAGQSCNAPSRVYVHQHIYTEFLERMKAAIDNICVGDGLDSGFTMGPLQHRQRLEGVRALLDNALALGATQLVSASNIPATGFFFPPTLLLDVPDTALICTEEPFGPLLPIWSFTSEQEVIEKANASDYGLAAFCFSGDKDRARRIADELQVGYLAINGLTGIPYDAPTGGIRDSGYGIEGGLEGVADFMHFKLVTEFDHLCDQGTADAS